MRIQQFKRVGKYEAYGPVPFWNPRLRFPSAGVKAEDLTAYLGLLLGEEASAG